MTGELSLAPLVVGLLLGACGEGASVAADASLDGGPVDGGIVRALCESHAGSRLTREVLEPEPGARQELGVIDSNDDGACQFVQDDDGRYTCYPSDVGGALFFQDAACTAAIVGVGTGVPPARFQRSLRIDPENACFTIREYRKIGAVSAVSAGQTVFRLLDGVCTAQLAPARDYYLAGPVLARDAFVRADLELVSSAPRLSGQVLVGSDGSSMCMPSSFAVDRELQAGCGLGLSTDQQIRCLPTSPQVATIFSDPACAVPVEAALISSCQAEQPTFAFQLEELECGVSARRMRTLDPGASLQRYDSIAGLCTAADPAELYAVVNGDADPSLFVSVELEREAASGERLERELLVSADGFAAAAASWFDTNLDHSCTFQNAADGKLRCLPRGMILGAFFSDALCAAPISLALVDECQAPPGFFAAPSPMGTRMLAATLHEEPVFALGMNGCTAVTGSFYKPAFEVAASSFVPAEISRLPLSP